MQRSVPSHVAATALVVVLAVLASTVAAQSTNPLGTATFSTPVFSVSETFTPVTTFASATGGNPTVIGGAGPSPATSSYQFTYTVPTNTVPAVPVSQVYQSLASSQHYNTATDALGLAPNPSNLQIADGAFGNAAAAKAVFVTVAAAAAVMLML